MNDSTEGESVSPGSRHIADVNILVAHSLLLTPFEKGLFSSQYLGTSFV